MHIYMFLSRHTHACRLVPMSLYISLGSAAGRPEAVWSSPGTFNIQAIKQP